MGKVRKDDPRQTEINWRWCERDAIIRTCRIEGLRDKNGDPVSMTTAKLVLAIINSHAGNGEAWLSFETMAGEVGKKVRTVKRAVCAMQEKGLLIVQYKRSPVGVPCNHYRVVWSELAVLVPERTKRGECASFAEDRAIFAEECATTGTQSAPEALKKPPPPAPKPKPASKPDPWRKVEEDFRSHLGAIGRLVKRFKAEGLEPSDLRAKIEEGLATAGLAANVGKFTSPSGAVFAWIENGVWPVADVLSIEHERERLARVAEMERQREAADAQRAQRTASQAARLAELEQSYGATLDALERWEMAALLDNEVATGLIMNGRAGMLRPQLLEALAQRNQIAVG
jgi:hypothetical protein